MHKTAQFCTKSLQKVCKKSARLLGVSETETDTKVEVAAVGPVAGKSVPAVVGAILAALYVSGVENVVDIEKQHDAKTADRTGPTDTRIEQVV